MRVYIKICILEFQALHVLPVNQDAGHNKQNRTSGSYKTGYMVEQGKPFQLDVQEFFGRKEGYRTQIPDKINQRNKESHVSLDAEAGNKNGQRKWSGKSDKLCKATNFG